MSNLLIMVLLVGCAAEQTVDPTAARRAIAKAWYGDQHVVWDIDWPAAPVGGPLTVETWRAGERGRYEILESTAPALVGQMLVFNGQQAWRYNRFEPNSLEISTSPVLSPVSDAFEVISRLINTPPTAASQQKSTTLAHGPAQKIGLAFENDDTLTVWIDQNTGLPARLVFAVRGGQADLQARSLEPLTNPPHGLFMPDQVTLP